MHELASETDLVTALQRFGDALNHEEQRREWYRGAERQHDRAPDALLRAVAEHERTPRIVDADDHHGHHRREEKDQIRNEVDSALGALGIIVPEDIGPDMRALEQRVAAAEHEGGAVHHVAGFVDPDGRRMEEV